MKDALKALRGVAVCVAATFAASAALAQVQAPANQTTTMSPIEVSSNSVRVSYRDLNLATPDGMGILRARITRASHFVCGVNRQPLSQQMEQLGCVSDARRGAYEQLTAARTRVYAEADLALVLPIVR